MFCNKCRKDIGKANVKFCPYCGGSTDTPQGIEAVSAKKDDAPKTSNGKAPVNKTAIIVAIIIAAAAVAIAFMITNNNGLKTPDKGRDNIRSDNNEIEMPENGNDSGVPGNENKNNGEAFLSSINIENIGDIIEFGIWRGEPIEWRILDIENDRALLISRDILTVRQYDSLKEYGGPSNIENWENVKVTWADSDIREWLNDDFLNEVFSKSEQRSILLSEISNPDNEQCGTSGGEDTKDKIFFLSISEVRIFFKDDDDRIANLKITEEDLQYILKIAKLDWGVSQDNLNYLESVYREEYLNQRQAWWWWLRSMGGNSYNAARVIIDGNVCDFGGNVHDFGGGVRPALYISLRP